MKKTMLSLAMTAMLGLASAPASAAFADFQVNEGAVGAPTAVNVFSADRLVDDFGEFLAPVAGFPTQFTATAVGTFGQYFANDGTTLVTTQLGSSGPAGYRLYSIFTTSGNIVGPNQFQATGGSFSLYLDRDANTTFSGFLAGQDPVGLPVADALTTSDDDLLAFTNTIISGSVDLNAPPGAFDLVFGDFTLTGLGSDYFFDPSPLYLQFQLTGSIDEVTTLDVDSGLRLITGDVSAVFVIPEPGSLALLSLGLAGLGCIPRRKSV